MTRYDYSETTMEYDCRRRMRAQGIITAIEVCNYNHSIDLAWITREGLIYAVELKLTDWKTALKQAVYHQNSVDFVSVAMPPHRITKPMKAAFMDVGVGYLEYQRPDKFNGDDFSHPFVVMISPSKNEIHAGFFLNDQNGIRGRIIRQHERDLNESIKFVEAFSNKSGVTNER